MGVHLSHKHHLSDAFDVETASERGVDRGLELHGAACSNSVTREKMARMR